MVNFILKKLVILTLEYNFNKLNKYLQKTYITLKNKIIIKLFHTIETILIKTYIQSTRDGSYI